MKILCVTGASGYIPSWLVKFFLQHGHIVKASVRDPNDPKKMQHLLSLHGAKERLKLMKANLLEEGSFDSPVEGCDGVFILYLLFTMQSQIHRPLIHQSGPLLQSTLNTSSAAILNLINGTETYRNATYKWINAKDVAYTSIPAYENPPTNGRYCMVERVAHFAEVVKILHQLYPTFQLPEKCEDDKPFVPNYGVSKEGVKSLGVEFTPLRLGIKETVESLKEKNFFKSTVTD